MATRLGFYPFNAHIFISDIDISFNKNICLYFLELQISLNWNADICKWNTDIFRWNADVGIWNTDISIFILI